MAHRNPPFRHDRTSCILGQEILSETETSSGSLSELVRRAIRRYAVLIGVVAVLFGAFGFARGLLSPSFTATSEILIKPIVGNALSPDYLTNSQEVTVGLETESHLIDDPRVTSQLDRDLQRDLNSGAATMFGSVVLNSQLLRIDFTAPRREEAQRGAAQAADAFLGFRESQAKSVQAGQTASLQKQIAALNKELDAATRKAGIGQGSPAADAAVQQLVSRLTSLQNALATAESLQTNPGAVVSTSRPPQGASFASHLVPTVAGLIFGFLLGVGLALWLTRRSERKRPRMGAIAGIPLWARLGSTETTRESVLTSRRADPKLREAYSRFRTAVVSSTDGPTRIALARVGSVDGLALVAFNLAESLAQAGLHVALVDAEVDQPQLGSLIGHPEGPGLWSTCKAPRPG